MEWMPLAARGPIWLNWSNRLKTVPGCCYCCCNSSIPVIAFQTPYETMIGEDTAVDSVVLPGIRLVDEDQVGENIKVECKPIEQVREIYIDR